MKSKPTVVDLFSGCGGLSLGFVEAGFDVLFANDFNEQCMETYKHNHKQTEFILRDIRKVSVDEIKDKIGSIDVDVVIGGPPCEGFSIAGNRDPNDPRNTLFEQFIRIIDGLQPQWILMENVLGLLSMEKGAVKKRVLEKFRGAKYRVEPEILNAADFGVPQIRNRVFFLGTKTNSPVTFPKPTHSPKSGQTKLALPWVSVWDAISDLPILGPGEERTHYEIPPQTQYQEIMRKGVPEDGLQNHLIVNHRDYMVKRFQYIPPGEGMESLPPIPKVRPKKTYSARCRRLVARRPSYTVTSHCLDELIHPLQHRAITPREAARLQSFPDRYIFKGPLCVFHSAPEQDQYEQIGDAVPPLLAKALALEIKKHLREGS